MYPSGILHQKCSTCKKILAYFLGLSLSLFPFLSCPSPKKQKRIFLHVSQHYVNRTTLAESKKSSQTLGNKTKGMDFHTCDVHCSKWNIFWSYPGHISPSLESPEVTTKSSFFFMMLPLLQPAYALSS